MLATPNGNMLWTCDPAIIKQLFTLHSVQVPVDMLRFYDIWGPTVGSVEGEEWKTHRKVVTYGLNPSTLPMVWREAIQQTETLIQRWAADEYVVPVVKHWTSRLALHTIASVFFDLKLEWKEYTQADKPSAKGYSVTFPTALFTVLAHLGMIFMIPRTLLRTLPFKAFKETHTALTDLTKYIHQLRANATANLSSLTSKRNKTILESIVVAGTPNPSRKQAS
jgi:cytochrome P450